MHLGRFSTLFVAVAISSPALYAGFWTHTLDAKTALLRFLIAVPVAAVMLAIVRTVTRDYGKDKPNKEPAIRAQAIAGEPVDQRRGDAVKPQG
jgi:hypothetical protein